MCNRMRLVNIDSNDIQIINSIHEMAPQIKKQYNENMKYENDGVSVNIKLRNKIRGIFTTSGDTLDQISRELDPNRLLIPNELFQRGISLSFEDFLTEKKDFNLIKRHTVVAFAVYLEKTIKIPYYSLKLRRKSFYIFISPESVRSAFDNIYPNLDGNNYDDLLIRFIMIILMHEFSHIIFTFPQTKEYEQIAEGIANWLPYMLLSGDSNYQTRHIIAEFATRQPTIYNHYMYMLKLRKFPIILKKLLKNDDEATVMYIHQLGGKIIFNEGEILSHVPVEGFIGFGQESVNMTVSETIDFVANIRTGVIIAAEINEIVGRLPEEVKIYSNVIHRHDDYQVLPNHIKVIPREVCDLRTEIQQINNDTLKEFKERIISDYSNS